MSQSPHHIERIDERGVEKIGTYMYVARVYSEMCLIFLAKNNLVHMFIHGQKVVWLYNIKSEGKFITTTCTSPVSL